MLRKPHSKKKYLIRIFVSDSGCGNGWRQKAILRQSNYLLYIVLYVVKMHSVNNLKTYKLYAISYKNYLQTSLYL